MACYHLAMSKTSQTKSGNTVRDELLIDIYANPVENAVAILIDRPFASPLQELVFSEPSQSLTFRFEDGDKDLGAPLKDDIAAFFKDRQDIHVFVMDMNTKEPLDGMIVPLRQEKDS